jgi:hypothetical protein
MWNHRLARATLLCLGLFGIYAPVLAQSEIVLREALVLPAAGRSGRNLLHTDAVEAQIVAGKWTMPQAGDSVTLPDGAKREWKTLAANNEGVFQDRALNGGYAAFTVTLDRPQTFILEAAPYGMVYVNGEPRAGDPYGTGYVRHSG